MARRGDAESPHTKQSACLGKVPVYLVYTVVIWQQYQIKAFAINGEIFACYRHYYLATYAITHCRHYNRVTHTNTEPIFQNCYTLQIACKKY